jgi:hypothetical protein
VDRAKPFDIPKRDVWEAYKRVKANQGAAGVDGQTIEDFEVDLGLSVICVQKVPLRKARKINALRHAPSANQLKYR